MKFNKQVFLHQMNKDLTPSLRQGLAHISRMRACAGIPEEKGDLVVIAATMEYGNPLNRMYNTPAGHVAPIPARPFLSRATRGKYGSVVANYINKNLPHMMAAIPTRGNGGDFRTTSRRALHPATFMKGLGDLVADNAKQVIDNGNFVRLSDTTIERKGNAVPLQDSGKLRNSISGWVER